MKLLILITISMISLNAFSADEIVTEDKNAVGQHVKADCLAGKEELKRTGEAKRLPADKASQEMKKAEGTLSK